MKKIVELIVKLDELELDGVGVDAIALVENPAIELDFLAFKNEEFVEPKAGEKEDEFIGRCMQTVTDEGYDQDQALAICYSYWQNFDINAQLPPYVDQTDDLKKKEVMSEEQEWILSQLETRGEEYDPMTSYFIDASKASFSTLEDFLKGIAAIDILGRKKEKANDKGETVYRYAGPTAERGFCKAMIRLNKVYRAEEISSLNSANPGFGRGGSGSYSVFEYKGGPNCRHFWEELTMFKSDGRTVFISQGPVGNGANAGKSNNMNSPSSQGSVSNNAYVRPRNFSFNINEEQKMVVGPAMIPNKMIMRKDENGNPYYVYFTEQTIRDIAENYFEEYKQNNTNMEHNSEQTHTKNTLLESWIVEDSEKDKSAALGFNVPKGSWMVSYKINDDKMWSQIKEGKLKGFSVEGYFVERAEAIQKTEATYKTILDILGKVK